jgi:hypothetical protein
MAIRTTALPICAVAVLLLSTPLRASAQPLQLQRADYASATGGRGVTSADFNRDGWIDIAVANHNPDGISVLLNQRGTGFAHSFIAQAGGPFEVTTGDLNNDGLPDIVVANADGNMINVAFGLPSGGFRTPLQIGAMGNPRGVTVADMDGDGKQDLVYTQYYFQGVQILYGDGAGNFDNRGIGSGGVGPNPQGVVAADFNTDGRMDMAVAATGGVGLTVLTQQASGAYARQDIAGASTINVLTVGDVNKDGRLDIAAASSASSEIFVYLNTRAQGWIHSATRPAGSSPRDIVAVDLNRDGALDLVTGNRGSSTMVAVMGDGSGGFPTRVEVPVGTGGRVVAVADYNNDGRIDVATGNEYAANVTVLTNVTPFPPSAFAFRELPVGTPTSNISTTAAKSAVADFDTDGKLDVVTQWDQGVAILHGNGSSTHLVGSRQGYPKDFKAGDFNGDGHLDILILDSPESGREATTLTTFLRNVATGGFTRISTPTSVWASQLEVGDLNRDGKLDAVLASDLQVVIQVSLGLGDGRFNYSYLWPDNDRSRVKLADVNRDGYLDIGIYSWEETQNPFVEYRLNNRMPQPFFNRAGVIHFSSAMIQDAEFGDVNHDGYLDLVMIGGYWAKLGVALGGPEGFGEPNYFDLGGNVQSFELVDITLDGHLDVVAGAGEIIPGVGDGTFAEAQRFRHFGISLQVVDYNSDGLPDVITPGVYGAVTVKLNQRTGTNTIPTVNAGWDYTFSYEEQFVRQEFTVDAFGTDPDLHRLTYQWTDAQGRVLSNEWWAYPGVLNVGRHEFFVTVWDGRGGIARDSVVYTVTPQKEIVLHVAESAQTVGNWARAADATAASGFVLRDVDNGAPKVTVPLANPYSYSEFGFYADPSQTYKLWVRLKATGDRWTNDSLWLQFSGAVDQNGRSFTPGTTSGIEVVLEQCSGCGLSAWGWRDDAWGQPGAMSALTLRFPQGGYQRVKIQTREDGVNVDQIVLSAEKYLTTRPGAVKNDTTILPATRRFED